VGRFLIVFAGLLAAWVGSAPSKAVMTPVTSRVAASDPAPLCDAGNLRVGRPRWVSPITNVNMSGVRVTNIGSRLCRLVGWPSVVAVGKGLPSVAAVPGAYGLAAVLRTRPVTLRPSGWASVLFAVSHSCEPQPIHLYDRLILTIQGRRFAVSLPRRSQSDPAYPGADLQMRVGPRCPPAVSPYTLGVHLSG
jgi:hypothetical protein